jgi:hypothetical protein
LLLKLFFLTIEPKIGRYSLYSKSFHSHEYDKQISNNSRKFAGGAEKLILVAGMLEYLREKREAFQQ